MAIKAIVIIKSIKYYIYGIIFYFLNYSGVCAPRNKTNPGSATVVPVLRQILHSPLNPTLTPLITPTGTKINRVIDASFRASPGNKTTSNSSARGSIAAIITLGVCIS